MYANEPIATAYMCAILKQSFHFLVVWGSTCSPFHKAVPLQEGKLPELKLSSPWVIYAHKVAALFGDDPEIEVEFDNDGPELTLYVANATKAGAIAKILPQEVEFGNVKMAVKVVPANEEQSNAALFLRAFSGNPNVVDVVTVPDVLTNDPTYVVFEPDVVQFYSDNGADINGLTTTLYQDIAKDVFGDGFPNIFFCTDVADELLGMCD